MDRVEALFVEIRKQRAAKKVQDELDRLDAEAAKAVHKAMQRLEAADVAAYCRVQGNVSKRAVFAAVDPGDAASFATIDSIARNILEGGKPTINFVNVE